MEAQEPKIIVHADPEIKELIPVFLRNRQQDVKRITLSLQTSDYETIRRAGHQMKGAGTGYGFDGISKIGADLEAAAKQKDLLGIQKGLIELEDYLNRLVIVDE